MISNLLSAIIGGLITLAGNYYVQRKLRGKRKHEQTLKALYELFQDLWFELNSYAMQYPGSPVHAEDVHEIAVEAEMTATKMESGDLKIRVLKALNQEHDNLREMTNTIWELTVDLRSRAYPTLHEIKEQTDALSNEDRLAPLFDDEVEADWPWFGPANTDFLNKCSQEDLPMRPPKWTISNVSGRE